MSCIKTGARIYFENYGMMVRGDVFSIGDCFIFRWNTQSKDWEADRRDSDYSVDDISNSEVWWHREDMGVTVVPAYLVTAVLA